jgi:hypothetical protein
MERKMSTRLMSLMLSIALIFGLALSASTSKSAATYTFTPQLTEACTGANQAPLDPTHWNSIGDGDYGQLPMYDELQVLNKQCSTTTQVQDDGQGNIKTTAGVDSTNQYITYTIAAFSSASEDSVIWTYLRTGAYLAPSYALTLYGKPGSTGDNGRFQILQYGPTGGTITYQWSVTGINFVVGDTITFAVYGSGSTGHWYVFHNGKLAASHLLDEAGLDNVLTSGQVGMQIDSLSGNSADTGVTQIVAGKFTVTN